jgi:hypothetical protein
MQIDYEDEDDDEDDWGQAAKLGTDGPSHD